MIDKNHENRSLLLFINQYDIIKINVFLFEKGIGIDQNTGEPCQLKKNLLRKKMDMIMKAITEWAEEEQRKEKEIRRQRKLADKKRKAEEILF